MLNSIDGKRIRKNVAELLRSERKRSASSMSRVAKDMGMKTLDLWYYEFCFLPIPANTLMSLLAYYQTDLDLAAQKLGMDLFFTVDSVVKDSV